MENKKTVSEEKALANLANLCSKGEHCAGELIDKMRRWGLDEAAQERVVAYLEEHHFIDETRYCHAFVEDKVRFDGWGRRKIEQALYQKGVASDISRRVLDEVDDEAYVVELKKLIAAKRRSVQAESDYEMRAKLTKYALGRGFGYEVIRRCIDGADELLED